MNKQNKEQRTNMARVDELDKSSVMDIQNSALLDIFLLGDGPVMVSLL